MIGIGTLQVIRDEKALLKGSGTLSVIQLDGAYLIGTGSLTLLNTSRKGSINVNIAPILIKLANKTFGSMDFEIPSLSIGMLTSIIPLAPQGITGWLPANVFSGMLSVIRFGNINVNLPALLSKGCITDSSDATPFNFGEINSALSGLATSMFEDLNPLKCSFYDRVTTKADASATKDYLIIVNEVGHIVDTLSARRDFLVTLMESMIANEGYILASSYYARAFSSLATNDDIHASVGYNGVFPPDVDESSRVWVMNLDTGASSQYEGYGFNSFYESEGSYYGVADDGIYLLEGHTDSGISIDALVEFGLSNLGTTYKKAVKNVYLGVGSSGKMYLKVKADAETYIYEARSSSTEIMNHRVDVGRGLNGTYFNFTLVNKGNEFDLETISFEPFTMSRKI